MEFWRWTGLSAELAAQRLASLPLEILPVGRAEAQLAAAIPRAKKLGLSLGDRLCLATAKLKQAPVLTTDRRWRALAADGVQNSSNPLNQCLPALRDFPPTARPPADDLPPSGMITFKDVLLHTGFLHEVARKPALP